MVITTFQIHVRFSIKETNSDMNQNDTEKLKDLTVMRAFQAIMVDLYLLQSWKMKRIWTSWSPTSPVR